MVSPVSLLLRAVQPLLPSSYTSRGGVLLPASPTVARYQRLPSDSGVGEAAVEYKSSKEYERPYPPSRQASSYNNISDVDRASYARKRYWFRTLYILLIFAFFSAVSVLITWLCSTLRAETIAVEYMKCSKPPWYLFAGRPSTEEHYTPDELYLPGNGSTRVGMIQTCSVPVKRWSLSLLIENHRKYAERWSLPWQIRVDIPGGSWSKIQAVQEWMRKELDKPHGERGRLEWLFYTDMDTMLVNPAVALEELVPPPGIADNAILVMAKDPYGWNGGNWFIRINERSLSFLSEIASYKTHVPALWFEEQSAIQLLDLKYSMEQTGEIVEIPMNYINSYLGSRIYPDPGAVFSIHWPSLNYKRIDLLPFLKRLMKGESRQDESKFEKNRKMLLDGIGEFWEGVKRNQTIAHNS